MSAGRVLPGDGVSVVLEPVLEALLEGAASLDLPAAGHGMEPTIEPGDRLIIGPFLGLPRPGQLVAARRDGVPTAHRLIEVEITPAGRFYRLQGDAEAAPGPKVRRADLLGRIVELVRRGRRVPVDESPAALRRALHRLAVRRRRRPQPA